MIDNCRGPCDYAAPSAAELEDRAKTHTDLRLVGRIGTITIYDLEYFLGGSPWGDDFDPNQGRADMRSVLVETAPGQFHEILVDTNVGGTIYPSFLVDVRPQKVLGTIDDAGGMYHPLYQRYFVVSENTFHLLDFAPVLEAASKAIPTNMMILGPTEKYDFGKLEWEAGTESLDGVINKVNCCPGRVRVTFRLDGGRVIPTGASYKP
jgi:hypothetical protein